MHIMCFDTSLFSNWIDRKTGKVYKNKILSTFSDQGKNRTILRSPKLQEFASKRFESTKFPNGIPGIELEVESGKNSPHPISNLYQDDVMCSYLSSTPKISELSFRALDDSGWYDVDYTNGYDFEL